MTKSSGHGRPVKHVISSEKQYRIVLIAALSKNGVIGRQNSLPWHIPRDLRRFKRLTMGKTLIMGRKTYQSIGQALPGRRTIVLTRQQDFSSKDALQASDIEEALKLAEGDVFIAGGAEIYRQTLDLAQEMYITSIDEDFEGDTFFPKVDYDDWLLVSEEHHPPSAKRSYSYKFLKYKRAE